MACAYQEVKKMMTSSNGNISALLAISRTKASDIMNFTIKGYETQWHGVIGIVSAMWKIRI